MVVIVVIVCALLLVNYLGFLSVLRSNDSLAPPHADIISVNHGPKFESQVLSVHFRRRCWKMIYFGLKYLVNDEELLACIYMFLGLEFISTHYYGVKYSVGSGCRENISHQ